MRRFILTAGFLAAFMPVSYSDDLLLTNGDRLTGIALRMAEGVLEFETTYAGVIPIQRDAIQSLTTDAPRAWQAESGEVVEAPVYIVRVEPGVHPPEGAQPLESAPRLRARRGGIRAPARAPTRVGGKRLVGGDPAFRQYGLARCSALDQMEAHRRQQPSDVGCGVELRRDQRRARYA